MMNAVILSTAKNLTCDGQMLHFVQHDNHSNKLRQNNSPILRFTKVCHCEPFRIINPIPFIFMFSGGLKLKDDAFSLSCIVSWVAEKERTLTVA